MDGICLEILHQASRLSSRAILSRVPPPVLLHLGGILYTLRPTSSVSTVRSRSPRKQTPDSRPRRRGSCLVDVSAVTGRSFAERDFRAALENGILLCQLLSCISPGLVKKINRLPTPIAGLGCEDLGLKGSQLFDPGDLQDSAPRPHANAGREGEEQGENISVCSVGTERREEEDSPKASIRDSGYIDCWDSERSDSLSPPRHVREDSSDSLDSLGSRSRQTPSPDVLVPRSSSDESDGPTQRKVPDVRKDDMLARRTSVSEPRAAVPFNHFLPNRSNHSGYLPPPPPRRREEGPPRTSWSTATSPVGGDRPLR
ncbi:hypothetical protein NHX12_011294 [Muraenolepis orangiensis]|uniref:DUF4757 domain-containing protein n=1 Tax=Muraenolepis orangiensis TaxID=630683 RepID=A0A9Q0I5J8_9TELE|nr:hypothetical protein NHX12_011294 [Muraenolepis orangiensis]